MGRVDGDVGDGTVPVSATLGDGDVGDGNAAASATSDDVDGAASGSGGPDDLEEDTPPQSTHALTPATPHAADGSDNGTPEKHIKTSIVDYFGRK